MEKKLTRNEVDNLIIAQVKKLSEAVSDTIIAWSEYKEIRNHLDTLFLLRAAVCSEENKLGGEE